MTPVEKYLGYLKTMSLKIASPKGMDSLFASSKTPCWWQAPHRLQGSELDSIYQKVTQSPNTMCVAGIGLVVGTTKRQGSSKRVSGPLIYAPVSFEAVDRTVVPSIRTDELQLNTELLLRVFQQDDAFDDDDDSAIGKGLEALAYQFTEQEQALIKRWSNGNILGIIENWDAIHLACQLVIDQLSVGEQMRIVEGEQFSVQNRNTYYDLHHISCFSLGFTFLAQVPSTISTHYALGKLIEQAG